MKKLLLMFVAFAAIMITGCASKKAIICEGRGKLDCPKHFVEAEASDLYKPAGVITKNITSCLAYTDVNVSSDYDGFACKEIDIVK